MSELDGLFIMLLVVTCQNFVLSLRIQLLSKKLDNNKQ
jgi:hypothetical protein